MACFKPIQARRTLDRYTGVMGVAIGYTDELAMQLLLPCGRCVGCLLERSRQWAVRCTHEASMRTQNCFITLTYSNKYLPPMLVKSHWQKFIKRLRKAIAPKRISFYHAGEYGSKFMRPHYHACIFGYDFSDDSYVWSKNNRGDIYYRSPQLESLWPFGYSTIGKLNWETAAYTARYCLKKYRGKPHKKKLWYAGRQEEYTLCSLRPAIGKRWIEKYIDDVYNYDHVVVNGFNCKPPRYYDKVLERTDYDRYERVKAARVEAAKDKGYDTHDRLLVKEAIQKKTLAVLERRYEIEEQ